MRAAVLLLALECAPRPGRPPIEAHAPPAPAYATAACVDAFVATQPIPGQHSRRDVSVSRVPAKAADAEPHYYVFSLQYGPDLDCEAGCFRSNLTGVALSCAQIGWVVVHDYSNNDTTALATLPAAPVDPMLLEQAWWPDAGDHADFFAWLAADPAVPPATREAAKHPPLHYLDVDEKLP